MKIVKVVPIKKFIIKRIPILGRKSPVTKLPKPKSKILGERLALFAIVSGSKKIVINRAMKAIPLEAKNEAPKEILWANKLITGPRMKPDPKAAPKIPKPLALFSEVVTSEITA